MTGGIRSGRWVLAMVIVALALRLWFVFRLDPVIQWHDGREYNRLSRCIVEDHAYLSPEGLPTASWPPAYPAFLSVFGRTLAAARIVQACIGALTVLLAFAVAKRLIGLRKAILAALFTAIYPLYIYATGVYYPVVILTLLLGAVFLLLLKALEEGSGGKAFCAGILGGITALTTASSLLALGLASVWLAWERRSNHRRPSGLRLAILFLVPIVCIVGSWSVRNYLVLGAPVPVSTNGGYNFWIGNFPGTKAMTGNRQVDGRIEAEQALKDVHHGEVELDHAFYREGLAYIKADPGRFVVLSLGKALNFWRFYPEPLSRDLRGWEKLACILSYGLLLPFGLYWLIRNVRRDAGVRLILLLMIAYTVLHAVFISKVRYRLPLDMLLVVAAAGGIGDFARLCGLRFLDR